MDNLTRREALKRGAALGGMLLWTTPAVQAIGMSRALAQETSGPCKTYCIKFEFTGSDSDLNGAWGGLGGNNPGNVLLCPSDSVNGQPPGGFGGELIRGSRKTSVVIRFPANCTLADTTESSPDELAFGNVAVKCGRGENVQNLQVDPVTREIEVLACGNNNAISHIELIIRCCT